MKLPRIVLLAALSGIPALGETGSTDVPKIIGPDAGTITTSTINVLPPFLVADVDVTLDITHSFALDLDVFLIHPDGVTMVELLTAVGDEFDNFSNTVLDDEASVLISDGNAPFAGTFRPEESLAAFDGLPAQGLWTLHISDLGDLDGGTLNSWSLRLTELAEVPEPNIILLCSASLAVLVWRQRICVRSRGSRR